jgi:hypothetical protein
MDGQLYINTIFFILFYTSRKTVAGKWKQSTLFTVPFVR